jgi:hypothetical protein
MKNSILPAFMVIGALCGLGVTVNNFIHPTVKPVALEGKTVIENVSELTPTQTLALTLAAKNDMWAVGGIEDQTQLRMMNGLCAISKIANEVELQQALVIYSNQNATSPETLQALWSGAKNSGLCSESPPQSVEVPVQQSPQPIVVEKDRSLTPHLNNAVEPEFNATVFDPPSNCRADRTSDSAIVKTFAQAGKVAVDARNPVNGWYFEVLQKCYIHESQIRFN